MKKKLTPNQEKLIEGLVAELVQVNVQCEAEKKASGKGAFDMSAIVSDVADKQRVVNENTALKTYWLNRIKVQMDSDVKKLNKALGKMGFFAETNMENALRKNPNYVMAKTFYPRIYITHKSLKTDRHEIAMEIDYEIITDRSKREDLNTPCGFKIFTKRLSESGYQTNNYSNKISTHTIEELFVNIQPWIKYYYEKATLVK